ncbi:MAG: pantoate--beta-alanine ligase [Cyclobacteriaceae bacterium]|nr:pantoate--beta-alanine ligase [Cyclobacteriaceae bacterium]MCH8517395.1 pantoate--beta-alanine ligase [Cyclobacteriaceae bacterium]
MRIFHEPESLKKHLSSVKTDQKSIGFVPTMGALHEGHLSLIDAAKNTTDKVVASIYINPTQFDNQSDLDAYPRVAEQDLEMLKNRGCDIVFLPTDTIMYPKPSQLNISFGSLENTLEGKERPGHFNGVGLIVSKLFHLILPDHAFFGQKDYQQFLIIDQLCQELFFPLRLHCMPIVREANGLAMSSRNGRLSKLAFKEAGLIYDSLLRAKAALLDGIHIPMIKEEIKNFYAGQKNFDLAYFEFRNKYNLQAVDEQMEPKDMIICIAVYCENVRLIDNLIINS